MRLKLAMVGLVMSGLIVSGQERPVVVRSGTANPKLPAVANNKVSTLSQLVGISPDEMRNEYLADNQVCSVPFHPYVSLRLAEKKYRFDRVSVLRQMCARRTSSFAFALQSAGGTYGTLSAPGPKQNQELRDAEREYLKEIAGALKARPYGK